MRFDFVTQAMNCVYAVLSASTGLSQTFSHSLNYRLEPNIVG